MGKIYKTQEEVLEKAQAALRKSLRNILSGDDLKIIESKIEEYGSKRKGYFGDLVEKYFFGINPGNLSEPDFSVAGVELKTTPLKHHPKRKLASKERLVFSMINYQTIVSETWESSAFLKKNKLLLLMFYVWLESQSVLDYEFKYVYLLDLINGISAEDLLQIKKDWEYIVAKIRRGEAHLLSEADTYYLGACTKGKNSSVVREQAANHLQAKPRAFSLKQQYLNYLIQTKLLGEEADTGSIFKKQRRIETIEEAVNEIFFPYIGKTDKQILAELKSPLGKKSKSYGRLIVNRIFGLGSKEILELEKANITLKVLTLEQTGKLKESISFPAFDYRDLVNQVWYDEKEERMSDFHMQLETKKFLFVIFQKLSKSSDIVLKKIVFWNFPMADIAEAELVWRKTVKLVNEGKIVKEIKKQRDGKLKRFTFFPGIKESRVAHVRPHATQKEVSRLPVADSLTGNATYTKHSFWLNAKYIQKAIEER